MLLVWNDCALDFKCRHRLDNFQNCGNSARQIDVPRGPYVGSNSVCNVVDRVFSGIYSLIVDDLGHGGLVCVQMSEVSQLTLYPRIRIYAV